MIRITIYINFNIRKNRPNMTNSNKSFSNMFSCLSRTNDSEDNSTYLFKCNNNFKKK